LRKEINLLEKGNQGAVLKVGLALQHKRLLIVGIVCSSGSRAQAEMSKKKRVGGASPPTLTKLSSWR